MVRGGGCCGCLKGADDRRAEGRGAADAGYNYFDMIKIIAYDPSWPAGFAAIGKQLREALGQRALYIHHIGSTSVPGLEAKDVIDVQITVAGLDTPIQEDLEKAGFILTALTNDHRPPGMDALDEEELAKRLYWKAAAVPGRKAHVHIRVEGKFNQRYPLLCRDYLRARPMVARAYGEIKRQLAFYFPDNVEAYYAIKDPVFDVFMAGAYEWAENTHWHPGDSDA